MPRLHSYHCDCEHCEFRNGFPFRGQTDSSCSGEIISDIFGPDPETGQQYNTIEMLDALCEAAIEVDAEPGSNSGFHVHVGIAGLSSASLRSIWFQLLRWEPTLQRIAGGRWALQRSGMNQSIRQCVAESWSYLYGAGLQPSTEVSPDLSPSAIGELFQAHACADRHSNLNISARRAPTWEFRLWNSTRAAWRMEMFTGLSVALMDPAVADGLAVLRPPQRFRTPGSGISDIALACDNAGHSRVAELLEKQTAYLNDRAATAPAVLTSL
jgi:hypothetical protein